MGLFKGVGTALEFTGNLLATRAAMQGAKKQQELSEQMMEEAQNLSASYQRPDFEIPAAYQQMMGVAQGRQFQQMPGMTMAQNQINQATSSAMNQAMRANAGAEVYGAISDIYGQQLGAQQNLAMQQAQYQDAAQKDYMRALEGLGGWQQQAWSWDKAMPYQQAQAKAAQLEAMGRTGQWQALQQRYGTLAAGFQGGANILGGYFNDLDASVGQSVGNAVAPGLGSLFGGQGGKQPSQKYLAMKAVAGLGPQLTGQQPNFNVQPGLPNVNPYGGG